MDADLPTWPDCNPGALCGAIPAPVDYSIPPGHQVFCEREATVDLTRFVSQVAACVSSAKADEQHWILGTVVRLDSDFYIVEDIMEESSKKE